MTKLSGVGSAARLAHAILLRVSGAKAGDLQDAAFPAPPGRMPVELCLFGGRSDGRCGQTLTEWVKPEEMPPLVRTVARDTGEDRMEQPSLVVPATHRAWARTQGYSVASLADERPQLTVVAPENGSRVWINPETPATARRLALKAVVSPKVPQIVWYVDGLPFATSDPDLPVHWPLSRGRHRFEVRLPLQPTASTAIHVSVE